MDYAIEQLKNKVSMLMEGEEISLLFNMVREELAGQILRTQPNETEKRNDLYWQSYGITLLERKMTAISNDISEEK